MQVVCTEKPVAYVSDDSGNPHERYNLTADVVVEARNIVGGDDAPQLVAAGCGAEFPMDVPEYLWDVNVGKSGDVVERHLSPLCPSCGRTADHLSRNLDTPEPYIADPFDRMVLHDPIFAKLSDDERASILATQELGRRHRDALRERGLWRAQGGVDAGYSHVSEGAVALTAATAKSVLGFKAGSAVGLSWTGLWVGFDGVTASAVPVLIEAGYCTFGANSPGTNSTGTTERQVYGRANAADWTGGKTWTTEPTTITVIGEGLLSPNGGVIWYDDPLGKEPDCALSEGFVLRLTAPAAVNVRATQKLRHS